MVTNNCKLSFHALIASECIEYKSKPKETDNWQYYNIELHKLHSIGKYVHDALCFSVSCLSNLSCGAYLHVTTCSGHLLICPCKSQ